MNALTELRVNVAALPRMAWILYAGTFLNRFGSFVMVFLVAYMTRRGFSAPAAGLALAAYGAGSLVASWAGGYLADHFGRRRTIILSMVGSALSVMALYLAQHYGAIVFFAGLTGMAAELYRPSSAALLADITPAGKRVTVFSVYRLAINLGFAIGPATAGFLADRSFFYLFLGDAITSLLFALIAVFALTDPPRGARPAEEKGEFLGTLLADRRMMLFLGASLFVTFVFFQVESTYPLHVLASGLTSATYGKLLSINGFLIVLLELPLTALTQRRHPERVIAVGFLLVGCGFALNAFAATVPALALAMVVWTLGEMTSAPLSTAYIADLAPEHLRGRYMGAWSLTWSLGLIIGPAAGTVLYARSPGLLFAACALCGIASAALVWLSAHLHRPAGRN